ncbi:MAG: hypothetical protein VKK04_22240 [Synechococcales bacterium]|nr:hypothetical protein [Synechococcales bacterium]
MVRSIPTFESIWQDSQKVQWRVADLISADKPLNFACPFLPESIARVTDISFLSDAEKLKLNQIRGNSYLHLFVLVEQFIIPMVLDQVRGMGYGDIFSTQALLGFAEEESKHIHLFQSFADAFEQGFGTACDRVGSTEAIAAQILSHHPLAVLLLTLQFEWTTQSHYLESIRNNHDEELDPRFCDLLKYHWLEEAQHTRLDTLLVQEMKVRLTVEEIEGAIADYLILVHLLHDALMEQVKLDIASLERTISRTFADGEWQTILAIQQEAYRWAFLCAGLTHPNFFNVLEDLSPSGAARVTELAKGWS